MNENMREMTDIELESVSGGWSGHVDKYSGVIGEKYYFVNDDDHSKWIYGKLLKSYEKKKALFFSVRTHEVAVERHGNFKWESKMSISGDEWTIYKNMF